MIYRFESYVLDDETYELRSGSELRKLPRKSFDLLRYLLHNASRVVSKAELFREIWPGEHVTESVLPVNVRTIRKALGDEGSETILKTVRGRGYRVACAVERLEGVVEGTSRATSRGLVGREPMLASLQADYEASVEGKGRIVLLYGEAGIGKTRVLDEIARWCRERSALVLQARCPDDAGAPPYWPILQMLRAGSDALASDAFRPLLERRGFDLKRAQARVSTFVRAELTARHAAGAARFRLMQSAVRLVEQVSAIVPVVLILDDLQCADDGTLRVCEAVARELSKHSVLAVAAYSDGELRRGSTLSAVIGAISSQISLRQVRLRGLDREDIRAFVASETSLDPPETLVEALHERTEGNPFFLRETLRLLVAEGGLPPGQDSALADFGLPQGIREAIGRRLDRLSKDCNHVLTWASVIGRWFSFPVLSHVCGLDSRDVLTLLAEAEEANVLSSAASAPGAEGRLPVGEYGFAHGLIRETIYEGISGPERVLRHRAVAEGIEALYGGDAGDRVFELARHFFEAAPGGDIQRAVEYCLTAARQSAGRFAYDDAIRHLDRAQRAEELRVPRDDTRYCAISMLRAHTLWRAGHYDEGQAEFLRAAELARGLQRFDLLGHCALGLVDWPRFNRVSFGGRESQIERERVTALVSEALEGLGDQALALRSRLIGVLVRTSAESASKENATLAERAVALARESGDDRALFHALMSRVDSLGGPGAVDEALERVSEAVELARAAGSLPRQLAAHESRIPLLLMRGEMERADADIESVGEIAARVGTPACTYASARFLLGRALGDGDKVRATELLPRVLQLGSQAGDEGAYWASRAVELWVLTAQGSRVPIRQALESVGTDPNDRAASAFSAYFAMLAGDAETSLQHFERTAEDAFSLLPVNSSWLWHVCTTADVCVYLGDRARAEQLHALLWPHRDLNVVHPFHCYLGSARVSLSRLALLLGRRHEAIDLVEGGIEFNQRIGARPALAWAQFVYASMLQRGNAGDRRQARALMGEVEEAASTLGVNGLIERFRAGRAKLQMDGVR